MKKGTLIAVGVFVVLLVVVFATREDSVNVGVPKLVWPALDKALVTKVQVGGASSALLEKGADGWKVSDPKKPGAAFAPDDAQVNALLDALADFKAPDHVTSKSERYAELEVDDAKGLKVTASAGGKVLAEIVVGKASKSGGVYVKLPGQAEVFSSPTSLGWVARKDTNGWRRRTLTVANAADLVSLSVKQADSELSLAAKDGAWTLESPAPAGFRFDAQAAARIAQQLGALTAQDFSAESKEETAATQVVAKTKDGKTVSVSLGREANGAVPARLEGDPQVYLLPASTAQQLVKRLEDLRDLSLWSFEVDKVKKLTLVAGGKKTVAAKDGGAFKVVEPKTLPAGLDFDPGQVMVVLNQLRSLRAVRVDASPEAQKACKAAPTASVELELEDKTTRRLTFGADLGASEVCVTGSADALTYAIGKGERARLEGGVERFKRPPPPPQFDPSSMRGLENLPPEIRAQLEAQLRQKMHP